MPEHVEIIRRGRICFVINHLNKLVDIKLNGDYRAIMGKYDNGMLPLAPYAVAVMEQG